METWLILYDIRNEKRLRRIAKLMERYGERVQKSVFEAMCDEITIQKMRKQASEILEKEDSLIVIKLCSKCWQKKNQYGVKTEGIGQYRQYEIL